jgi:hypothetical protein
MEILFDHNVSRKLRPHFLPHIVTLTKEKGWDLLENGDLLEVAQHSFDVMITTDNNLYHQNKVANFNLAVIVLRAFKNKFSELLPLMAETLEVLNTIQPGEVVYVYADEKLKGADQRKGKGPRMS